MKRIFSPMALWVAALAIGFVATLLAPATAEASEDGVVNINTASAKQLQTLDGIGAKKAQAIIDHRNKRKFKSVDELRKVKGFGPKLVERLRPRLVVQGETTMKPKRKGAKKKR